MRDLAIYGAGGFGREVSLLVQQINAQKEEWNLVGYFDDGKLKGDLIRGWPVLGGIKELNNVQSPMSVVVAVARPKDRKGIVERISNPWIDFPTLIHPDANIGGTENIIGRGTIITAGSILTTEITIGEFCIVNLLSTIGHDVKLSNYTSIMPGVNISGAVVVEELSLLGTGCKILQNLSIGRNCVVGAGAVVTKDVPADTVVTGIPARKLSSSSMTTHDDMLG